MKKFIVMPYDAGEKFDENSKFCRLKVLWKEKPPKSFERLSLVQPVKGFIRSFSFFFLQMAITLLRITAPLHCTVYLRFGFPYYSTCFQP